mmetsp:Transcript_21600/g.59915  ORF Transcript_21600/g.59915 Transcript_21600/m.59915 type:complete len:88 (+) Transcript_21600:1104-1367(+)|eukprot:1089859-Pelagomonas_calceolata.AAC.1
MHTQDTSLHVHYGDLPLSGSSLNGKGSEQDMQYGKAAGMKERCPKGRAHAQRSKPMHLPEGEHHWMQQTCTSTDTRLRQNTGLQSTA